MPYYCVCSAGGSGRVVERTTDPTPEEAIQWSGPYGTPEEALLNCEGTTCPQGFWCVCGRKTTSGQAKVVYYPVPPEWFKYQIHLGPYNTANQARSVCVTPVDPNANPLVYKYHECKTITTSPALDICKPDSSFGVPVTLECSLACTPLGYPMTMGVASLNFLTTNCIDAEPEKSKWIDRIIAIGLSCINAEPVVDGVWVGEYVTDVAAPGVPGKGFTMRIRAMMTVVDANTLQLQLNFYRLIPGSEQEPVSDINSWGSCGAVLLLCYRQLPPGGDINDRTVNWTFVSELTPFNPGGACATDIRYISVGISLLPWRFGCDGTANAGAKADCSLASGNRSYSCFAVSVRPTDSYNPLYQGPAFAQLGVNDPGCGGNVVCGCYTGELYLWGGSVTPSTSNAMQILLAGCGGELVDAKQRIQFVRCGGYDILLKTIAKGPLCVAVRGSDNPQWGWQIAGRDENTFELYPAVDHVIGRAYFPTLIGKPEVVIIGMEFPNPEITGCIHELPPLPEIWPPAPNDALVRNTSLSPIRYSDFPSAYLRYSATGLSLASPMLDDANQLVAQVKARYTLRCIHLGEELGGTACCGSSALYQCAIYDKCRRYGVSKDGEPICGTCIDFTEG